MGFEPVKEIRTIMGVATMPKFLAIQP